MCQKVTNLFDCGHTKEPSVLHPKDPEDCPEAVQANRHNARTGKLLPCINPPTTRASTGGYCQTTKCKKWYLKQYGWYCCQFTLICFTFLRLEPAKGNPRIVFISRVV
ncbi:hypothetical protein M0657_011215 [Pyricularia oryzae]|nr:hypothetical protein M0657_011215 [Pyricularia oryzae]